MKKVGIWIRVSTSTQAQGDSPETHEKRARGQALAKDWDVVEVYHLEAVSGKSVINHSEARRMLNDVKTGRIEGLIFSKIARLARNTKELLEFAEIFEEHNAGLISIEESIDTSTPSGRFFYTLLSAMAQWEREEISDRIAASIPIRAQMGKSIGGQAPFGYSWEDSELILNEDEAPIRKLVFELFIKHKRKRVVARILNEKGYRTRKGKKFNDGFVKRVLEDSISKGVRRVNYLTTRKGFIEDKHEDDWVYIQVPPIIEESTWNGVQAILKEQKEGRKVPLKMTTNLFTGIAQCSCGGKMYVLSKTEKYTCNDCKRKITCDDLEAIFKDQLQSFSISESSMKEVTKQTDKEYESHLNLLKKIEKDIRSTETKIESLFTLHEQGHLETEDFSTRYQKPKDQLESLQEEKETLKYQLEQYESKQIQQIKIFDSLKDIYGKWDALSKEDKRVIIVVMASSIIISENEVEIILEQLNPSFLKNVTFEQQTHLDF